MSNKIARYGWLPDRPDLRDHLYAGPVDMPGVLPVRVDLRPRCAPVYDPGQPGNRAADASAGAIKFERMKPELLPATTGSDFWTIRVVQ